MILNIGANDPKNKILWDEETAVQGGSFTLADVLPSVAMYVLKGVALAVNHTSRVCNIVKTGLVVTGSTVTATRVAKNELFKVGDVISKVVGGAAVAITAIDYSNDGYNVLSHLTNGGAFSADDVIFEAAAVGASSAYKYTANGLLNDNTKNAGSITMTRVAFALSIQELNLPYPVSAAIKTALTSRYEFV